MEIPGELPSRGLPAPGGTPCYLGVLSLYSQSVCQPAGDFKGNFGFLPSLFVGGGRRRGVEAERLRG